MIEQLPQPIIAREQFCDRTYGAQLGTSAAARAHLPQPALAPRLCDERMADRRQHRQRHRDEGEHARPRGETDDPRLMKTEQTLRVTKAFLDGLITNDKFCFTHRCQLHLRWWRRPLGLRHIPLLNDSFAHSGGSHETAVEHPAPDRRTQRRPAPPRPRLSTPSAMGTGTTRRTKDAGGRS